MTPIGIDLSLTSTGFSCGDRLFVISTPYAGVKRLQVIRDHIVENVLEEALPVVIIEGYSFASKHSHAHSIGELGGVVRLALFEHEVPFVDIPPTIRAKFATGKGNAGKTEVMSSVSAKTGIVFSGKGADDLCDAWILEEIGRAAYSQTRFDWPAERLKTLEKVDWL